MLKVAINGLGGISRATLKIVLDQPALHLTAINDVTPADDLAYLLKSDMVYGRWNRDVRVHGSCLRDRRPGLSGSQREEPSQSAFEADGGRSRIECTGDFRKRENLVKHIEAGARFVILSAPAKSDGVPTPIHAVSTTGNARPQIISCASCTTKLHHAGCGDHRTQDRNQKG